jgi:hypothetical protein
MKSLDFLINKNKMFRVGIERGRDQIKCKFVMGGVGGLERRTLFLLL